MVENKSYEKYISPFFFYVKKERSYPKAFYLSTILIIIGLIIIIYNNTNLFFGLLIILIGVVILMSVISLIIAKFIRGALKIKRNKMDDGRNIAASGTGYYRNERSKKRL